MHTEPILKGGAKEQIPQSVLRCGISQVLRSVHSSCFCVHAARWMYSYHGGTWLNTTDLLIAGGVDAV